MLARDRGRRGAGTWLWLGRITLRSWRRCRTCRAGGAERPAGRCGRPSWSSGGRERPVRTAAAGRGGGSARWTRQFEAASGAGVVCAGGVFSWGCTTPRLRRRWRPLERALGGPRRPPCDRGCRYRERLSGWGREPSPRICRVWSLCRGLVGRRLGELACAVLGMEDGVAFGLSITCRPCRRP